MKENLKDKLKFIGINVVVAVLIVIAVVVSVRLWTNSYTQFGVEYTTPSVIGLTPEEASVVLEAEHLCLEVIDSTYLRDLPFGTIVEQNPPASSHVKASRSVYVIVNAHGRQHVQFPNLVDMSLRQAIALLHNLHLDTAQIIYQPSEYKGLILEAQLDSGATLLAGTSILEGTRVRLVVGNGPGTELVKVPNLIGKDFQTATALLLHASLTAGAKTFDVPPTVENIDSFLVFKQNPGPGTMILEGSRVDFNLSRTEKVVIFDSSTDDNEFF